MNKAKAKEIRDSCQLTCICKTCGNEQGGVCALGSCESAREMDRCPLTECHYCVGGKVATIADKVRELREAFREQYGIEVGIQVWAHGNSNPQLTRKIADNIGREMAGTFIAAETEAGHMETKAGHEREGELHWFGITSNGAEISLFYKEEPHEQSD